MVIYFYPKDDTPGCTKEACSFRDSYEEFTDRSIKVIGISADDVESHKNFAENTICLLRFWQIRIMKLESCLASKQICWA